MERGQWLETFRVYPCWCQHPRCRGWREYTDREIQVILASQDHYVFFEEPDTTEAG